MLEMRVTFRCFSCRCTYYPGAHKFDLEMQKEAFAWFDRRLKQ
jgi:hypothetical protein